MAQGQGLDVATPLVSQRREIFCVFFLRFLTKMHTFLKPKKLLDRSLPELPRVDLYGPRSEPISDPVGPTRYSAMDQKALCSTANHMPGKYTAHTTKATSRATGIQCPSRISEGSRTLESDHVFAEKSPYSLQTHARA
jgi:hypothetical protein